MENWKPFEIEFSDERIITPGGLALIGQLLKHTDLRRRLNGLGEEKGFKHANSDCVIGYLGLLCQGKTDYEDMREMQEDPAYYSQALGISSVASAETVRQRLDALGFDLAVLDVVEEESAKLLSNMGITPGKTFTGHVALDVDMCIHDNGGTKREGVERAYNGIDGYAPMYAYLGEEGYCLKTELREGNINCQNGTVEYLGECLTLARQVTNENLLVRMDSGNDSLDNIKLFAGKHVDFLIKRNPRKETPECWLETAMESGKPETPREGKVVYTGEVLRDRGLDGGPVRLVFQVTVRHSLANGQMLIEPKIDVATWWTSLPNPPEEIIRLYREHATCEQFHSEIKSDIGLERFPSGKFDTNAAILKLGFLAYNMLRIISQTALSTGEPLSRKSVFRLRAKTVMKRLIFCAARVVSHARKTALSLGRSNYWRFAFAKVHKAFA